MIGVMFLEKLFLVFDVQDSVQYDFQDMQGNEIADWRKMTCQTELKNSEMKWDIYWDELKLKG